MRAAQLAEERRRKRFSMLALAIGAVLCIGLIGVAVLLQYRSSHSTTQVIPAKPTGTATAQKAATSAKDASGIDGVLAWDTGNYPGTATTESATQLEHDHVTGPVTYTVVPPVGGPHSGTWLNAGIYTKPVPSENAVHDLEHGAVWITYRPTLAKADVATLAALVNKQSLIDEPKQAVGIDGQKNRFMTMSPWADASLPAPIVFSAWGHQLRVDSATDPRLQKFIDVFRNSATYAPEHGSAVDGQPVTYGGRADSDGAVKANPAGAG